jgi:hypothetical protein
MDAKMSRKESRLQPSGTVYVLMDNISDLYPVMDATGLVIEDIEMLDDDREELLDRSMFDAMKQRGGDPLNLSDGVQIEETIMGEVSALALMAQITAAVSAEGPGVKVSYDTYNLNGKTYLKVNFNLAQAA